MSMRTLQLSNVVFSDELEKKRSDVIGVTSLIDPVVNRLAMLNPLWTFIAIGRHVGSNYRVQDFTVKSDSEILGTIGVSYMGAKGNVIAISNDRIGKTRTRSSMYRTSDTEKAILMAKKMFGKMNPTERVDKAAEVAERVVTRGAWNKERELSTQNNVVENALQKWAKAEGYAFFLEYIAKEAPLERQERVTTAIEKLDVINVEMRTIEKVQTEFNEHKTALVIRDAGKYLVRVGDKVNLYDDNDFPVDLRMKLGMLKLVEDEQYLADIGCKVTSEIFVLLVDEGSP